MSDHDPRLDKPTYEDVAFEPRPPSRGLYLVVVVVAAIVAATGLMFFAGHRTDGNELARSPDPAAIDTQTNGTRTPTVPRVAPIPATPAPEPVTPAPSQQP